MALDPSKVEHLYRSFRVCVGYSIRTAEEKDLPAIECFRRITELGPLPETQREELIAGAARLLLAELNGHPIGQVEMRIDGERAVLEGLRVLDPMRGFGVAQHLVDEAEKLCGRAGCKATIIAVPEESAEARELFRTMGYTALDGGEMEKDIRWKSCHLAPDDPPAEELCRADIDAGIG